MTVQMMGKVADLLVMSYRTAAQDFHVAFNIGAALLKTMRVLQMYPLPESASTGSGLAGCWN